MDIRDGHADIFADAHRCGYPHYPTCVGYSAIYADNADIDADIRIRMAIPSRHHGLTFNIGLTIATRQNLLLPGFVSRPGHVTRW